jgi:hypothetical protein
MDDDFTGAVDGFLETCAQTAMIAERILLPFDTRNELFVYDVVIRFIPRAI